MKYVVGIDLGTSAVKVILVNQKGDVCFEVSKGYPLIQEMSGYSEQDPEEWVEKTSLALAELLSKSRVDANDIEGISFSGQMHGLVLLNKEYQVIRNAILWNDTRTTEQCGTITHLLGERLLDITKNAALEGFTLPKLLWVKEHEPQHFSETAVFMLPKDYLRFQMTGAIHCEFSDAAGTLLLDVIKKCWSKEIADKWQIPDEMFPPLIGSHEWVGTLTPEFAERTGLKESTKVFAGGADNACGAIGAGILSPGHSLCSIGTSGVVLSYEEDKERDFRGKVHFFNHGARDAYYIMGVTLAAGYSLSWLRDTFARDEEFEDVLRGVDAVPIGANGLMFTPYLAGERTPHADSVIRGSFIGIAASHSRVDFVRAVMEGITFSLRESIELFREQGKKIDAIVSIGGGAKNECWLQMQADIFRATVIKLESEQGPSLGAAMLAAFGCGWFETLEQCAKVFIRPAASYYPKVENVERYEELFGIYKNIYPSTKPLNEQLAKFRKERRHGHG